MALVSIVMPCFNAARYLGVSIQSVIDQTLGDWELVVVNDGSTDESESIARHFAELDSRIKVVTKTNGGYVTARLHGYKFIDKGSKYILFYDADDRLHSGMLSALSGEMEKNERVGAVYCDHRYMDEDGNIRNETTEMPRFVPSRFWVAKEPETLVQTPFISIFCWTKMIEPMTLMRRVAYEQTPGWDADFGKGQGNIGEGVYLFSEIALKWDIHFINEPLYYYRRYASQMSAVSSNKMFAQARLVIGKWKARLKRGQVHDRTKVRLAIMFFNFRLSAFKRAGSFKHQLRYTPWLAFISGIRFIYEYLFSLPLVFSYKRLLD
jgi:glycosyltransferase involved in cell wall biosynthesis